MNNNTLQQINLCYNEITADGVTHLNKLITKEHSALIIIELYGNPLKDQGVNILLQLLPSRIEHNGLCKVKMTSLSPLSCQSLGDALHKVKSISFDQLETIRAVSGQEIDVTDEHSEMNNNTDLKSVSTNYWEVITTNLMSTTVLEHLEIRLTDVPTSELINAIGQNKSIKTLQLSYSIDKKNINYTRNNWAEELAQYIQYNTSLKQLIISGSLVDNALQVFQLLTESLTINTSITSMRYEEGINISDVYKALDKLKENNTLEELTLSHVYMDMDMDTDNELFLKIENCVQQINKTRSIKGITNLKVKYSYWD